MTINETKCGQCKPCEAGGHCAHVLMLTVKEWAMLARLEEIAGRGYRNSLRTKSSDDPRKVEREPHVSAVCSCGSEYEIPEYLGEFLERHRAPWPLCGNCQIARAA